MLTNNNAPSKRFWSVPDCQIPQKVVAYHPTIMKSYSIDGLLKTAGRGQEFVCYPCQNKKVQGVVARPFVRRNK